jgi:plasmid stability protein
MKTTLELPDQLLRKAKATAAERGQSLKHFVTEALRDKLAQERTRADGPAWMRGFGGLKHLHKETLRVQSIIDREFRVVESGGCR